MFALALGRRKRSPILDAYAPQTPASGRLVKAMRAVSGYNALVILGIVVFLVSDLLKVLYESALEE